MPSTNCQVCAFGPIQPSPICSRISAAPQPKSSGVKSARPAVVPVSPRFFQADFRSSSMPAIQTKIITAQVAMPLSILMTWGWKTKS